MEIPVVQTEDVDEDKPEVLNDTIDDDVSFQMPVELLASTISIIGTRDGLFLNKPT